MQPLTDLLRPLLLILLAGLCAACSTLPPGVERPPTTAFDAPQTTTLGRLFATEVTAHPGLSGIEVLDTGRDALQVRLALLELAEGAVDLQYYIWNSDHGGRLMADAVLRAADRGVRVRLLVDDIGTGDRDAPLAVLHAHANIQVRIYNPNAQRGGLRKWLALIGEFGRLNQRMHNKAMVVDGAAAITGGRNIGDEYFDLHHALNFRDRDLLAVGPVVVQVGQGFDAYWNSERSFPVDSIVAERPGAVESAAVRASLARRLAAAPAVAYALPDSAAAARALLEDWRRRLTWARADLLVDPVQALDNTASGERKRVAAELARMAQRSEREVLIESAYLVLGDPGAALLDELRTRGVPVRALTNSLASNDVVPNHAAYARRRRQMLENGIELYELRPDAASCRRLVTAVSGCNEQSLFGLHAKSMIFDRTAVFVGSFNLNLRSVYLNSEIGLLVHSPALAQRIARDIEENMQPVNSWRVELDDQGRVVWRGVAPDGTETSYGHEPESGFWRRLRSGLWALLPIEKYL